MDRSGELSPASRMRRTLLKLPLYGWLTNLCSAGTLAKAFTAGPVSPDGVLASNDRGRTQSLNGTWSLTYGPCQDCRQQAPSTSPPADWPTIPAAVPGNVELDMVAAGRLEPLEKGSRVYQALQLESYQWWYRRTFQAGHGESGERAELVFDGLDCIATVWLNGKEVGQSANMLIPHRFDVTAKLLPDQSNQIVVRIDPAVAAGLAAPRTGWEHAGPGHWESLPIRKAPHMYGWDIMPRIVSAGLWRDVYVEWMRPVRLSSVYWFTRATDVKQGNATVSVAWEIDGGMGRSDYKIEVALRRNGETAFHWETPVGTPKAQRDIALDHAALWWPRGYGEQALYEATVTLLNHEGDIVDRHVTRLGVRTIELDRTDILTEDGNGKFGFVVNGVPIFVKGTDYSCLDALHSRDAGHLDRVFPLLVELNCNMARCWGGNVYPEDRFFNLCDEAGILVWQDFAMACAVYPRDKAFLDAIHEEAKAVVPRLRNHPSLALWSGNNECDDAFEWNKEEGKPAVDPNLDLSTREVIPGVLKDLDPHRAYLPSSPYHSPAVFAVGNKPDSMPEVHLWGPRGYFKAPFYTASPAHFASEIGYHGCPSRASLERMMDPEFVEPWVKGHQWNDQWLTKSVRFSPEDKSTVGRNDLMINQIKAFFGAVPDNLDEFILASQITQAEALKFFVELFRQQKGLKQGILWWNIRDGWPIVSDAVVDYYNTRKLAFYYLQRVQRDVQAICCEAAQGQHSIAVVNDTLRPGRGHLEVSRVSDSSKLFETSFAVEPNGKASIGALPHPAQTEMWRLQWTIEGAGVFTNHYLATSTTVDFAQYKNWMDLAGLKLA